MRDARMNVRMSSWSHGFLFFIGAVLCANAGVWWFVSHERTVYYWDLANYWNMFRHYTALSEESLRAVARELIGSVRYGEYNGIAVVPLIPVGWMFGTSRVVFLLALTNLYAIPAACLGGAMVAGLFPERRTIMFRLACLWCLLSAVFWFPLLRGMVAVGGLALAWLVMALVVRRSIARTSPLVLVTLAVIMAGICLYRRFFLFWVVAFFVAAFFAELIRASSRSERWRGIIHLAIMGVISSSLFAVVAWPQVVHMFTADIGGTFHIYRDHANPLMYLIEWARYAGGLLTVCMVAGSFVALRSPNLRWMGVFCLVHFLVVILLFGRVQVFEKHHYLMLFSTGFPMAMIAVEAASRYLTRAPVVLTFLLAVSSLHSWLPRVGNAAPWLSPAFAGTRMYPMIREDFDELSAFMRYLDTLPGANDPQHGVYLLASSEVLNDELARSWQLLHPPYEPRARIRATANKDAARFGFPRELLKARYVVLADPVQIHLKGEHAQMAVRIPLWHIKEGRGFGEVFAPLDQTFVLGNGIVLRVYEKTARLQERHLSALRDDFFQTVQDDQEAYDFTPP